VGKEELGKKKASGRRRRKDSLSPINKRGRRSSQSARTERSEAPEAPGEKNAWDFATREFKRVLFERRKGGSSGPENTASW